MESEELVKFWMKVEQKRQFAIDVSTQARRHLTSHSSSIFYNF